MVIYHKHPNSPRGHKTNLWSWTEITQKGGIFCDNKSN